jgi:Cft2 family RNA processing exonuclease
VERRFLSPLVLTYGVMALMFSSRSSPENAPQFPLDNPIGTDLSLTTTEHSSSALHPLSSLQVAVSQRTQDHGHISLVVRESAKLIVFLEIVNTSKEDAAEILRLTKEECAQVGAGSDIIIHPLKLSGVLSPPQRAEIRSCHVRLPHLYRIDFDNREIELRRPVFDLSSRKDELQVLSQLKGALKSSFRLAQTLYLPELVSINLEHHVRAFGSEDMGMPSLSAHAKKIALKCWPIGGESLEVLRGVNAIAIDQVNNRVHLTQEGPSVAPLNHQKLERKITHLLPDKSAVATSSLGASHQDLMHYLKSRLKDTIRAIKYHQSQGTLEIAVLADPKHLSNVFACLREIREEGAKLSRFTIRPFVVENKCELTEALFKLCPSEWGFSGLTRSDDNTCAIIHSRYRERSLPNQEVELFLKSHFVSGVYTDANHFVPLARSGALFSHIFQALPTRCDLREVCQSHVTKSLELVVRQKPEQSILDALSDHYGVPILTRIRPASFVPDVIAPAVGWLDKNNGFIRTLAPRESQKMLFEGRGGCKMIGGSCLILNLGGARILLDCGSWLANSREHTFPAGALEGVDFGVFSHIHTDHTGGAIRAAQLGLTAPLIMTRPTAIAMYPILTEQAQRRSFARGWIEKLYSQIRTVPYDTSVSLTPSLSLTLHDAGHILGSATAIFRTSYNGAPFSLAYTGDYSTKGSRYHNGASPYEPVDVIIAEGTYGMREQPNRDEVEFELIERVKETVLKGGTVIMPSLAYGRAQEVLAILKDHSQWFNEHQVPIQVLGGVIEKNQVYDYLLKDAPDIFSLRAQAAHPLPLASPEPSRTNGSRQRLHHLDERSGKIIVLAGGMVWGRSEQLIARYGSSPDNLLILSCYQVRGTIGRKILDFSRGDAPEPREFPNFKMQVHYAALSAHSTGTESVEYITRRLKPGGKVVLVHGEPADLAELREWLLATEVPSEVFIPSIGEQIPILGH